MMSDKTNFYFDVQFTSDKIMTLNHQIRDLINSDIDNQTFEVRLNEYKTDRDNTYIEFINRNIQLYNRISKSDLQITHLKSDGVVTLTYNTSECKPFVSLMHCVIYLTDTIKEMLLEK
jgi:hypothetical protein